MSAAEPLPKNIQGVSALALAFGPLLQHSRAVGAPAADGGCMVRPHKVDAKEQLKLTGGTIKDF